MGIVIGVILAIVALWAVIIPNAFPDTHARDACLAAHNEHNFQIKPRIEIVVDGKSKLLPDNIGRVMVA